MPIFKGAGVAIVTPMKANGEVNYDKLSEIIEDQIAGQTDAIIICGTTGESSTLTHEEHVEVIRYCIEKVAKRVPVIAGTGSNCTETAVYLSQEAEKAGADGVLLVTPYYNKATQKGLIAHYTKIANAISIPVILYNVPSRTGCNLLPETVAELVKNVDNIVGIKEASGNISQIAKLMHLTDGKIELYSGNDDQVVPILALGGVGVISVVSNVAPKYMHDMVVKFLDGDIAGSTKMQLDAIPLCNALFCEVNPIPVKAALNLQGKRSRILTCAAYRDGTTESGSTKECYEGHGNLMIKVIMNGCNGHMGQVISELIREDEKATIVAGIDVMDNRDNGYPVFTNIFDCDVEADVMIDFSSYKATDNVLFVLRAEKTAPGTFALPV